MIMHDFEVLLLQISVPDVEDYARKLAHHLQLFLIYCICDDITHGAVMLRKLDEVFLLHQVA